MLLHYSQLTLNETLRVPHWTICMCIAFSCHTHTAYAQAKVFVPSHGQWNRFSYGKHETQERWEKKKWNEWIWQQQQRLRLDMLLPSIPCARVFFLALKHLPIWVSVYIHRIHRRWRRRTHYPNKSKLPSMTKCYKILTNCNSSRRVTCLARVCVCVCIK